MARAETDVQVLAVGTVPPILSTKEVTSELTGAKLTVPDISKFLDDVGLLIKAFDEKPPAERVASQTLRVHFRSYFGLEGYPGLPAGVEGTVAQHRQAIPADIHDDPLRLAGRGQFFPFQAVAVAQTQDAVGQIAGIAVGENVH